MIEYKDPYRLKYCARIIGGQQFNGVHEEIDEWIHTVPGAYFDKSRSISYIDGVTYFHDLEFATEEDLVAFKLKFAGKVR